MIAAATPSTPWAKTGWAKTGWKDTCYPVINSGGTPQCQPELDKHNPYCRLP